MKKLITLNILLAFLITAYAQERVVFYENFDAATKPSGWTQEKVIGLGGSPLGSIVNWQYTNGGYYDYPEFPYQGARNAMFQLESDLSETTKLVTPPIDLSDVSKPELRFAHVQQIWENVGTDYWDRLRVYYKRGADSAWVLLQAYENPVSNWIDRSIQLPDSSKSSTYYIAFEGTTGFGWGTCIDTMRIMETGLEAKYVSSYSINQASTGFIPTNTLKNPILYINFNVKGNDASLYLDSLRVTSLNTDDSNIANNGVKLYATVDSVFSDPIQISSGVNFVNGIAWFKNINYDLPRGSTTIWITYDIATAANHYIHNNTADAKIEAEGIYINGYGYPFADKSPEGKRLIKEALFNDSFETDLSWILNGSFERAIPLGLGDAFPGNPDPDYAYNGSYVLGTDLTSDGAYSNELPRKQDSAVSPVFDCLYYKDVTLYFARWLNVEYWDKATIDISNDNKNTWTEFWRNSGAIIEDSWNLKEYDLNAADFKEYVSLRISLDTTNDVNQYTGWNIDDFIIVGDFISKDVGISSIEMPETGCGHTTSDEVTVYIRNYAGEATPSSVPLRYSIDGSTTYTVDAYPSSIDIGGNEIFTFSVGADLSIPGSHTIKVETILSGDEISSNNSKSKTIFSYPTLTLPYSQNFETNNGYYLPGGVNSSWKYGTPASALINSAASGTKAWVTNLTGAYSINDSSFLESPCFDFSGTDSIIFEFKCKGISEDQTDGLTVLYSLDEGGTWNLVPNDHDYYWNWYNEADISELELPGIDETGGQWLTFRQLLPPAFSNQSSVKFRFAFESNGSNNLEGFGIDDIKIYEAPADVGVSSITEPYTACKWSDATHVKVNIENYGVTTLESGTKIPVGLDFQGVLFTKDTLELASPLAPGATAELTFSKTVNMSTNGDYDFNVYSLLESNPYFYNETVCNDTISATIRVDGMPNYDIGWIVGSDAPDTLLDAGIYDNYSWYFGGSEVGTNQTYRAQAEGIYYVTVSRTNIIYCEANDSIKVVQSLVDVKMDSISAVLKDSCQRFELTEIRAAISNIGVDFINDTNDTIPFGYQINNLPIVFDTLILDHDVTTTHPNDTVTFTFRDKCDLTAIGEYTIKVFTNFAEDLNRTDDTLSITINTWGLPEVNLAYDTIYSSQADTLTLDAGSGFASYLWNPGDSITQTITPTNSSYYYKVTVTDVNGCGSDKDSTFIETHDLGISAVYSPANICEDFASATTSLNVEVTNYSDSVYTSPSTVKIFYKYDSDDWVELNPILNVGASDVVTLNNISTIDATNLGEHTLKIYTSSDIDANHSNDTLEYTFNTWPEPHVNLAYDTIFTSRADTVILVAQEGFVSYAWSDGSTTNDSLIVTDKFSKEYRVTVTDEHCGTDTDTTQIITYNLGVVDFLAPGSACQHSSNESVRVTIKNFSQDILTSGTSIPVGYILNGTPINETMILGSDLNPSQTINYTFTTKANLAAIASYNFKLFTDFKLDVNHSNDTLIDVVKTFGYPSVEIGDDIFTMEPETLTLIAPTGFNYYKWNDGTTTNTLDVSYPATKLYSVTVTDINGCTANDHLTVYTYDVGIASINTPITTCEFANNEELNITILNNSEDTLLTSETIDVSYSLNGSTSVNEILTLAADFLPGTTVDYSFTSTLNLTTAATHNIEVSCAFPNDVNSANDNLSEDIDAVGYPSFTLGDDIYTTNPVGMTLSTTPAGYASYEWQDASTNSSFTISNPASAQYAVTVTDAYGCEGSDVLEVYTYNVAASEIISPVSQCELSATETVSITIINNSQDLLLSGETINVSYTLNSGSSVNESFDLSGNLSPGGTVNYTFTQKANLSANQVHEFELFAELASIDVETDDAIIREVDYQKPVLNLGPDINTGAAQYTIDAGAGYSSYLWFDNITTSRYYTVDINDQNPNHYYAVEVTNSYGCTDEDSIQVTFTTTPDLAVTRMISPESDCWNENDTYPVQIIITNSGVVNLNPGASFTVGFKIDDGDAVTETFNLSTAMDAGDTREHTFADEISFASAKVYKFKPFVKLADDINAGNDTLTTGTNIDISAPEVVLAASDTISFTTPTYEISTSESYLSYLWSDGSEESTLVISETGLYKVTVTDEYGCQGEGSLYCVKKTTGIDNLIQGDGYKIRYYPNPASEKLMIQIDNRKSTDIIIEIVSQSGQILYNNKLSDIESSLEQIDVTPYARGVYYFKFKIKDEVFIRKIILQ